MKSLNGNTLYYEIYFDEKDMAIIFSLPMIVFSFVCSVIKRSDDIVSFGQIHGFDKFIPPAEGGWGFGKIFILSQDNPIREGWMEWKCFMPASPDDKRLQEISATIGLLVVALNKFSAQGDLGFETAESQFLSIENFLDVSDYRYFDERGFSFFYSKQVLNFCQSLWVNRGLQAIATVMENMKKTYRYLTGIHCQKSLEELCFSAEQFHDNPQLITLRCPGAGACYIAPNEHFHNDFGIKFSTREDVTTEIQRFTLLAGVITLANLARNNIGELPS